MPEVIIIDIYYNYDTVHDESSVGWSMYPQTDEWGQQREDGSVAFTKRHIVELIAKLRDKTKLAAGSRPVKFNIDHAIISKLLDGGLVIADLPDGRGVIEVADREPIPVRHELY